MNHFSPGFYKSTSVALVSLAVSTFLARGVTVIDDGFELATHPTGFRSVASGTGSPYYGPSTSTSGSATLGTDAAFPGGAGNKVLSVTASANYQLVSPLGGTVSLANLNDSFTLSFRFRFTNIADSGNDASAFRFGLFSSAGTPVVAEGFGTLANNDPGYYLLIGESAAPTAAQTLFNEAGGTAPILAGGDRNGIAASGAGTSITDENVHSVSFTATRTSETQISFSWTIDSITRTATETATEIWPLRTTFDELAFSNGGFQTPTPAGVHYNIDDVLLTATNFTPIPEPASVLFGVFGLFGAMVRRRRC